MIVFKFQYLVGRLLAEKSDCKSLITLVNVHLLVKVLSEQGLTFDLGPTFLPFDLCYVVHSFFEVDFSGVNNSLKDHCIGLLNLEVLV